MDQPAVVRRDTESSHRAWGMRLFRTRSSTAAQSAGDLKSAPRTFKSLRKDPYTPGTTDLLIVPETLDPSGMEVEAAPGVRDGDPLGAHQVHPRMATKASPDVGGPSGEGRPATAPRRMQAGLEVATQAATDERPGAATSRDRDPRLLHPAHGARVAGPGAGAGPTSGPTGSGSAASTNASSRRIFRAQTDVRRPASGVPGGGARVFRTPAEQRLVAMHRAWGSPNAPNTLRSTGSRPGTPSTPDTAGKAQAGAQGQGAGTGYSRGKQGVGLGLGLGAQDQSPCVLQALKRTPLSPRPSTPWRHLGRTRASGSHGAKMMRTISNSACTPAIAPISGTRAMSPLDLNGGDAPPHYSRSGELLTVGGAGVCDSPEHSLTASGPLTSSGIPWVSVEEEQRQRQRQWQWQWRTSLTRQAEAVTGAVALAPTASPAPPIPASPAPHIPSLGPNFGGPRPHPHEPCVSPLNLNSWEAEEPAPPRCADDVPFMDLGANALGRNAFGTTGFGSSGSTGGAPHSVAAPLSERKWDAADVHSQALTDTPSVHRRNPGGSPPAMAYTLACEQTPELGSQGRGMEGGTPGVCRQVDSLDALDEYVRGHDLASPRGAEAAGEGGSGDFLWGIAQALMSGLVPGARGAGGGRGDPKRIEASETRDTEKVSSTESGSSRFTAGVPALMSQDEDTFGPEIWGGARGLAQVDEATQAQHQEPYLTPPPYSPMVLDRPGPHRKDTQKEPQQGPLCAPVPSIMTVDSPGPVQHKGSAPGVSAAAGAVAREDRPRTPFLGLLSMWSGSAHRMTSRPQTPHANATHSSATAHNSTLLSSVLLSSAARDSILLNGVLQSSTVHNSQKPSTSTGPVRDDGSSNPPLAFPGSKENQQPSDPHPPQNADTAEASAGAGPWAMAAAIAANAGEEAGDGTGAGAGAAASGAPSGVSAQQWGVSGSPLAESKRGQLGLEAGAQGLSAGATETATATATPTATGTAKATASTATETAPAVAALAALQEDLRAVGGGKQRKMIGGRGAFSAHSWRGVRRTVGGAGGAGAGAGAGTWLGVGVDSPEASRGGASHSRFFPTLSRSLNNASGLTVRTEGTEAVAVTGAVTVAGSVAVPGASVGSTSDRDIT